MALYVARYMRRVRRPSVCRCREALVGGLAATEYVHCGVLHRPARSSAAGHGSATHLLVDVPGSACRPVAIASPVVSSPSGEIALATDPPRKSVLRAATRELLAYNGPLALAALMTVWLSGAWIVY